MGAVKKYLAIFFLVIFALRPAYFVGYFSYFQFNIDYFIENYCINKERPELECNGKCYLMEQLAAADQSKKEQQADHAVLSLLEAFVPLFVPQEYGVRLPTLTFKKVLNNYFKEDMWEQYAGTPNLRPPIG
ncbi:hypothetical protein BUL40_08195 [Croceivirga radicis]|uniref:Uncharacterized protein n=1 Tax=Croceivirga radicis TaxID=1929488 RepID=A0A1V6LSC0_9FLAO|nr:hypothetical protein [Croceivirga radicis]OQD43062.1 hypothetical protein BUL40_08195 [Croceivirga radicis]